MGPLDLVRLVRSSGGTEAEQLHALAAMADAPGADFAQKIMLPVQNDIPAFKLGNGDLGSTLAGTDHGVAAPVIGQKSGGEPTIGELLIGEN